MYYRITIARKCNVLEVSNPFINPHHFALAAILRFSSQLNEIEHNRRTAITCCFSVCKNGIDIQFPSPPPISKGENIRYYLMFSPFLFFQQPTLQPTFEINPINYRKFCRFHSPCAPARRQAYVRIHRTCPCFWNGQRSA